MVAKRPWLCTLLGSTKCCYIFLKHHRGKMVGRQGQEDGDGRVGEAVSTVSFCVVTDSQRTGHLCPTAV